MIVKLNDVQNAKECMNKLANMDLPIAVSYKLSKLVKKLNKEYDDIEEFRVQLIKKYGEEDGEGNVRVNPESEEIKVFLKEYSEFMDTEVELDIDKIEVKIEDLDVKIKSVELLCMEQFINFV